MKYIGPFLRINTINKNNIKNQLTYISKESIKNVVLYSKCGVVTTAKHLKIKDTPNNDINILNNFSPLLCIYKKNDSHLISTNAKLTWNSEKIKKEVEIWPNAIMTLSLFELTDYYKQFKDISQNKYLYYKIYSSLCKNQLIFYSSYLRNIDGVFVDKKDITETLSENIKFEDKSSKFKFSNQALIMCALYKYAIHFDDKYSTDFNKFSADIFNMLKEYRNELYSQSIEELNKLCFSFNLYYDYSKNEEAKLMLMDLCDYLINQYENKEEFENCKSPVQEKCLAYLNLTLAQRYIDVIKFKDTSNNIFNELIKLYNDDLGIFISEPSKNKIKYTSLEIITYLIDIMLYSHLNKTDEYNFMIYNIYKYQVINAGLLLSWPEAPGMNDVERYYNFSLKSDDLIEESNFTMPNVSTSESNELAPVFVKNIIFNTKKECFKNNKSSFYSDPNMFIFFLNLYMNNVYNNLERTDLVPAEIKQEPVEINNIKEETELQTTKEI